MLCPKNVTIILSYDLRKLLTMTKWIFKKKQFSCYIATNKVTNAEKVTQSTKNRHLAGCRQSEVNSLPVNVVNSDYHYEVALYCTSLFRI